MRLCRMRIHVPNLTINYGTAERKVGECHFVLLVEMFARFRRIKKHSDFLEGRGCAHVRAPTRAA